MIDELEHNTIGNAVKKANLIGREIQSRSIADAEVNAINKKYAFCVSSKRTYIYEYTFRVGYNKVDELGEFSVFATNTDNHRILKIHKDLNNGLIYYNDGTPLGNTNLAFVINNLKAGQRMNLNKMLDIVNELNNGKVEEPRMVSEKQLRKIVKEVLNEYLNS